MSAVSALPWVGRSTKAPRLFLQHQGSFDPDVVADMCPGVEVASVVQPRIGLAIESHATLNRNHGSHQDKIRHGRLSRISERHKDLYSRGW